VKIGRQLFISSGAFSIAIAVGYWLVAREITGTFLLGFMAFALSFVAGYMIVAERDADLWGDLADATHQDAAGQIIGTYSVRSPIPIWIALAVTCLVLGTIVSPILSFLALISLLGLGAAMIVRSG
jgi:hypothetical protein